MLERYGARAIAAIILGMVIVGLFLFGLSQCSARKSADKQAEVSKGQGGANLGSGQEALNTVSNVEANAAATDERVVKGQQAVRNAPEGQKGKATLKALCQFKTYVNTPQCKEPTQ